MKTLQNFLMEALQSSDIVVLKEDFVLYTKVDSYDMFIDHDQKDLYTQLEKYLGKDDEIIIPKGSFIQFGSTINTFCRHIDVFTKKINFTGLSIVHFQEDDILAISRKASTNMLNAFTAKNRVETIEGNM